MISRKLLLGLLPRKMGGLKIITLNTVPISTTPELGAHALGESTLCPPQGPRKCFHRAQPDARKNRLIRNLRLKFRDARLSNYRKGSSRSLNQED